MSPKAGLMIKLSGKFAKLLFCQLTNCWVSAIVPSSRDMTPPPCQNAPTQPTVPCKRAAHFSLTLSTFIQPNFAYYLLWAFPQFRFRMAKQLHIGHADLQTSLRPAGVKWPPLVTVGSVMPRVRGTRTMKEKSEKIDCIAARQNRDLIGTF